MAKTGKSKIQQAERSLQFNVAALAMGQIAGASLPTIAKLAFGVRSALERVEGVDGHDDGRGDFVSNRKARVSACLGGES